MPLSTKDPTAQDLLWIYAQRRRAVDAEFADDLEAALQAKGFKVSNVAIDFASMQRRAEAAEKLCEDLATLTDAFVHAVDTSEYLKRDDAVEGTRGPLVGKLAELKGGA